MAIKTAIMKTIFGSGTTQAKNGGFKKRSMNSFESYKPKLRSRSL